MKPKQFATLAAAAGVSLVVAIATYLASVPWTETNKGPGEPMMAALSTRGPILQRLKSLARKETLKLASKDANGSLSRARIIRRRGKGARTRTRRSEARLVERKTAIKDRHDLLGLGDYQRLAATRALCACLIPRATCWARSFLVAPHSTRWKRPRAGRMSPAR